MASLTEDGIDATAVPYRGTFYYHCNCKCFFSIKGFGDMFFDQVSMHFVNRCSNQYKERKTIRLNKLNRISYEIGNQV